MREVGKYLGESKAIVTVYFSYFSSEIEKELNRAKEEYEASS